MVETQNSRRRALVTGATGYIGSNLAKRLVAEGWDVHVIVRPNSKVSALLEIRSSITVHEHDGSTRGMIDLIGKAKPFMVFHLASLFLAHHRPEDIDTLLSSNLLFSTQLAEAMATNQVKYVINTGTSWQHYKDAKYNPVNLYAATKQAFEDILAYYIDAHKLKVITLALFDTYGPQDPRPKLIPLLWQMVKTQEPLAMSPGDQLIDLVYISDVVDAYMLAADLLPSQSKVNISYGVSSDGKVTLRQLVSILENVAGSQLQIRWGARPYRMREIMHPWDNFEKLPGWTSKVPLVEGIFLSRPRISTDL
jgi:nucleoside-diphosphate-sugar epimerase